MSMGPEFASILMSSGAVLAGLGAVARPFFRYLTEKRYVDRAEPEDLPDIAKALHPQIELRRGIAEGSSTDAAPQAQRSRVRLR